MKALACALSVICLAFLFSCEKEVDPLPEKNIKELLVAQSWKIQEITFTQNGVLFYYLRNGLQNTVDYDNNENILFNEDSTGAYTAGNFTYPITWEFMNPEQNKIKYTIYDYDEGGPKAGVNAVVIMENVNVSSSLLKYAEIYTNADGAPTVSSVTRIPL